MPSNHTNSRLQRKIAKLSMKQRRIALLVIVGIQVLILYYVFGSKSESLVIQNSKRNASSSLKSCRNTTNSTGEVLPECPETPPNLQGKLNISFSNEPASFETSASNNPLVKDGGRFKPPNCKARSKVAVLIPFRNRVRHLKYFLHFMLPVLQRQELDFKIYVINQFGNGTFNRAKLLNIGFVEALRDYDFECFVLHDVDYVVENDYCLYTCPSNPRHLSVAVDKYNYEVPNARFGGVTQLTRSQFERVNGYSNLYWGWGAEDEDMYQRLMSKGMPVKNYPADLARYKTVPHQRDKGNEVNPDRFQLLQKIVPRIENDGLNSLQYKVVSRDCYQTYTNITVDVFAPK